MNKKSKEMKFYSEESPWYRAVVGTFKKPTGDIQKTIEMNLKVIERKSNSDSTPDNKPRKQSLHEKT